MLAMSSESYIQKKTDPSQEDVHHGGPRGTKGGPRNQG